MPTGELILADLPPLLGKALGCRRSCFADENKIHDAVAAVPEELGRGKPLPVQAENELNVAEA